MIGQRADFLESRDWLELRYRVLKKHNRWCQLCGHKGSPENPIQVDHIKPRSTHPHLALVESNLQVLCRDCNLGKSNKDSTDWRCATLRHWLMFQASNPAKRLKLQQWSRLKVFADQRCQEVLREMEKDWLAGGKP